MPLSKRRAELTFRDDELHTPAEADLRAYVVFTQRREGVPHLIAGYVDAPDDAMALVYAKEHYGQDQECVSIWAFEISSIAGTHADHPTSSDPGPSRTFRIFTQQESGDLHTEAGEVQAIHSQAALEAAKSTLESSEELHSIWIVDAENIAATEPDELIWRFSDQTYRLARGYSKDVRQKWEAVRAAREVDEYQKEDLKEMF